MHRQIQDGADHVGTNVGKKAHQTQQEDVWHSRSVLLKSRYHKRRAVSKKGLFMAYHMSLAYFRQPRWANYQPYDNLWNTLYKQLIR